MHTYTISAATLALLSTRNELYGWVKKKLNATALTPAAPSPSQSPPLAATTGGTSRISASVPGSSRWRNGNRQTTARVTRQNAPAAPKRMRQIASPVPADAARSSTMRERRR